MATSYAIAQRMGVNGHTLRNDLRRLHSAGIIAPAGFAMLPTKHPKRGRVWRLAEGTQE